MTGRKAALWSIPAIGAALGVLGIVHAMGPDRDAIRAALADELAKLEAMPADDPVRKDRRIHELKDVENYQIHARALWLKLERLHGPVHEAAQLDEEARKKVLPFLARGVQPGDAALDECRALLDSYGNTRYGPALRARQKDLRAAPEKPKTDPVQFLATVSRERVQGRFARALTLVDDALRDPAAAAEFIAKLKAAREEILKSSKTRAERLLAQAATDRDPAPLEKALPDFSGLPEAGRIEAMIRQLRTR